jgi:hypothetical protein
LNDNPIAENDSASTAKNAVVSISVLTNDSDVDGDQLVVTSVSQPPNGTVTITAGGKLVNYKSKPNFSGIDTFTYTVSDGHGGIASALVAVTVTKK